MVRKGSPVRVRLRALPHQRVLTATLRCPLGPSGTNGAAEVRLTGAVEVRVLISRPWGSKQRTSQHTSRQRASQDTLDTDRTLQSAAGGRLACVVVLVACGLFAALAFPTTAPAQQGLVTGFSSSYYQSGDATTRAFWLNRTVESGAGLVRLALSWQGVAGAGRPPDPAKP